MKIFIISLCLCLAACCPDQLVKQAPVFDARLMEECPPLVSQPFNNFSEVLETKALETKAYIKCKNSHSGLIEAVTTYQKEFNK